MAACFRFPAGTPVALTTAGGCGRTDGVGWTNQEAVLQDCRRPLRLTAKGAQCEIEGRRTRPADACRSGIRCGAGGAAGADFQRFENCRLEFRRIEFGGEGQCPVVGHPCTGMQRRCMQARWSAISGDSRQGPTAVNRSAVDGRGAGDAADGDGSWRRESDIRHHHEQSDRQSKAMPSPAPSTQQWNACLLFFSDGVHTARVPRRHGQQLAAARPPLSIDREPVSAACRSCPLPLSTSAGIVKPFYFSSSSRLASALSSPSGDWCMESCWIAAIFFSWRSNFFCMRAW